MLRVKRWKETESTPSRKVFPREATSDGWVRSIHVTEALTHLSFPGSVRRTEEGKVPGDKGAGRGDGGGRREGTGSSPQGCLGANTKTR